MKYAILTFGCRANQADSLEVERGLQARGGEASAAEQADLVVVNTCAVTMVAEQAARQAIRRIARVNPGARILATGCYATRAASALNALPVWRVVPNEEKQSILEDSPFRLPPAASLLDMPMSGPGTGRRTVHLLRVQTGCNEHCAYCIVPSTRGPSRSTPVAVVLAECRRAASAGFRDVMLTGVHLGSYGRDLSPAVNLADLVTALSELPGDVRFRLSALEPMDVDLPLVDAVGRGRFALHFHLPLQHASNRILTAMGRPYTIEQYDQAVSMVRGRFPAASIGADVMAGFPGETERDFAELEAYLDASPLTYLHVFPFSPRPGTGAASMGNRPPGADVRRRVRRLRAIGRDLAAAFRRRFVGEALDGLTIEDGSLVLTENYLRVRIAPGLARNTRVKVRITADGEPMVGAVDAHSGLRRRVPEPSS